MPLDPNELVTYLAHLKAHNTKAWFDANREQYQHLRTQFVDVVQDVIFGIARFDNHIHIDMKPEDTLFRINRDVRFSKDKSPYKTTFSAAISTHGRRASMPMYYFHITESGELFAAGGLYMPEPDKLLAVRNHVVNRPDALSTLLNNKPFIKMFGGIEDEAALKRVPKGFDEDAPHADYLKLKSWTVARSSPIKKDATVDKDVQPFVLGMFEAMYPLIAWLRGAVGI